MPKKLPPSSPNLTDLPFPYGGLHEDSAQDSQPPGTTPDCLNSQPYPSDGKDGGGQRPGLTKWITNVIKAVNTSVDEMDQVKFVGDQLFSNVPAGLTTIEVTDTDTLSLKSGSTTYMATTTATDARYVSVPVSGVNANGDIFVTIDNSTSDYIAKYSGLTGSLAWSTNSGIDIYSATNQTWFADSTYFYVMGIQKLTRFTSADGTLSTTNYGATITNWLRPDLDRVIVFTAATLNLTVLSTATNHQQSYSGTIYHVASDSTNYYVFTTTNAYQVNISTGTWSVLATSAANPKESVSDATYFYLITAVAAYRINKSTWTMDTVSLTGTFRTILGDASNYYILTSTRAYKIVKSSWASSNVTITYTTIPDSIGSVPKLTSTALYLLTSAAAYKIDLAAWTLTTITKTFTRYLTDFTSTSSDDGYYLALTTTNKMTVIDQATWSAADFDYGGAIQDYEWGIQDNDYVYLVATRNASWTGHTGNATVFKVNATTAALVWACDTTQQPAAIATDSTGVVYVTGSNGSGKDKTWQISSAGSVVTSDADRFAVLAYSGDTYQGYSIAVDTSDNVYIGVGASTAASTACDAVIIEYDSSLAYVSSTQISQATGGTAMSEIPNYLKFDGVDTFDNQVKQTIDAAVTYDHNSIDTSLNVTNLATGGTAYFASAPLVTYTTTTPSTSDISGDYTGDPTGNGAGTTFATSQTFTYPGTALTTLTTPIRRQLVIASGTNIYGAEGTTGATLAASTVVSANWYDIQMASIDNMTWIVDGTNYKVYDPSQPFGSQVDDWEGSTGDAPWEASPAAVVRLVSPWYGQDRLVLSDQDTWYMPKAGDPTNFDYLPGATNADMAVAANTGQAGDLGDQINGLIAYDADKFLFGCDGSIHALIGNPAAGGYMRQITGEYGVAFGRAWCIGPNGVVFFFSTTRGPAYLKPDGSITSMCEGRLLKRFSQIDLSANRVKMVYDSVHMGLNLIVIPTAGGASTHYWWDARKDSWWRWTYANAAHEPKCILAQDGRGYTDNVVLVGCADGYVRTHSLSSKSDDGSAINSYMKLVAPPEVSGMAIMHQRLRMTIPSTSDGVDYAVYSGDSVAQALAASASFSGTNSQTGRTNDILNRSRGNALVYRFGNANLGEAWLLDSIKVHVEVSGMARRTA